MSCEECRGAGECELHCRGTLGDDDTPYKKLPKPREEIGETEIVTLEVAG